MKTALAIIHLKKLLKIRNYPPGSKLDSSTVLNVIHLCTEVMKADKWPEIGVNSLWLQPNTPSPAMLVQIKVKIFKLSHKPSF